MLFRTRLKHALRSVGVSQTALAEQLGISRVRLNNYITGRSEPDLSSLVAIADALNFSVDYLLGRDVAGESASAFPGEFRMYSDGPSEPLEEEGFSWISLFFMRQETPEDGYSLQPVGWLQIPARETDAQTRFRQYALFIVDDSMAPNMMPGDIACVQPAHLSHFFLPINAPEGTVYAMRRHPGDKVGVALCHCYARDNLLVAFTGNRLYAPSIFNMSRIVHEPIVGKVVGVWRSYADPALVNLLRTLPQAQTRGSGM